MLARKMWNTGVWPDLWKYHWVHPLHKKKTKSDVKNYRGLHLTSQLSKVIERVIGRTFLPYLERIGAAGPCQFAYRKNRGLQDALAFLLMSWISSLSKGNLIGLYCSDVSGAFDRVAADRLLQKLKKVGSTNKHYA